jgi:uncharacterized protein YeaO (DUF488 family)
LSNAFAPYDNPSPPAEDGAMPLKTKRWCDPAEPDDGFRLLICRYRPRGVRREDETWDAWFPDLGPSRELHAAFYGKPPPARKGTIRVVEHGPPISWDEYRRRYLAEMQSQQECIEELALMLKEGKPITLLCSSACVDERHCHRTLLKELILNRR